jgi:hypothetical protein
MFAGTARLTGRALAGGVLLLAAGCDVAFDPKGPYTEKLVVYSVLTTRSDTQFVRVYTTYNPSQHDPSENKLDTYVRNARVTLMTDSLSTILPAVVIPRVDRSRYTDDIVGYAAYPYTLRPGKTYTLRVTSDKGNAEASVAVPSRGDVHANNPYVLKTPEKYDEDLSTRVRLSRATYGYLVRIFVEFETKLGSLVTRHREEIPSAVWTGEGDFFRFEYPVLVRRNEALTYEIAYSGVNAYKACLIDLKSRYGAITVTGATYVLTQVDKSLYVYYNLANGFLDPFSIRADLPDFTNVRGGLGIFGSIVEDSVYVDLRAMN